MQQKTARTTKIFLMVSSNFFMGVKRKTQNYIHIVNRSAQIMSLDRERAQKKNEEKFK